MVSERPAIPGTPIFDGAAAARGYALNAMCFSFNDSGNRAAYKADPEAYFDRFELSEAQRAAVRSLDVAAMIAEGGNIYYLAKLAGIHGLNVQDVGAQMTGSSVAAFKQRLLDAGKALAHG